MCEWEYWAKQELKEEEDEKKKDIQELIATLRQENEQLKAQIEKMKCCGNCDKEFQFSKCADCYDYSKWKLKE